MADELARNFAEANQGRVLNFSRSVPIRGGTAFRSLIDGVDVRGTHVQWSLYVFLWKKLEYRFACQHPPGDPKGIQRGCDLMFSTMTIH